MPQPILIYRRIRSHTGDHLVIRPVIRTAIALFILAATLHTGAAVAHGNVTMEQDSCMRNIGENIIHLSAYQPENDLEGHYCSEIPQTGETIIVVDLVDPSLRNMPISVKIYKGFDEADAQSIIDLAPHFYRDGIISFAAEIPEAGQYSVDVTVEGVPPLHYQYLLRVEMINYGNVFRAAVGPVVGLLIILLIMYKVLKSKRFRKWKATKHRKED
jgi:hypothetical protein